MADTQDIKIAVLEEQIKGLREQHKAHADTTKEMLGKLFDEMDELKSAMNRGKGVFAASLTFAGVIGGVISIIAEQLWHPAK